MSTRCNIQIQRDNKEFPDTVQLYRHCDGYPESILPSLMRAFNSCGGGWEAGRVGKSASLIIGDGPTDYEPETKLGLHGDIAYFYRVTCKVTGQGLKDRYRWYVEIFKPTDRGFWNDSRVENMTKIAEGALEDLVVKADKIGKSE